MLEKHDANYGESARRYSAELHFFITFISVAAQPSSGRRNFLHRQGGLNQK